MLQTVFSVLDAFKDRMSGKDCEETRQLILAFIGVIVDYMERE